MKARILVILFGAMGIGVFAQEGSAEACKTKYGKNDADSVECVKNLSLYKNPYFQNGQYDEAVKYWRQCLPICPCSQKSLYINGVKMYRKFISAEEKDSERYIQLYDTIKLLYDKRIENFGQEGYVRGRKGSDMLKYDKANPKNAYGELKKSFDLQGNKMEGGALIKFYQALYLMTRKKEAEKTQLIELYPEVMSVVDHNLKNAPDEKKKKAWTNVAANIDKIFLGVAKCEDIVGVFKPRFETNPQDTFLLESILKALKKKECTDDQLYLDAAMALDKINPSFQSKFSLGQRLAKKDQCGEAVTFFKAAADLADNDDDKIKAHMKSAGCYYNLGQYSSVRQYCQKAIGLNPNHGVAYIMIGDAYAKSASKCGEDNCTKKSAYWAAVDKYEKARAVDSSVASKAATKISGAKANYPKKDDCFFLGLTDGQAYTVGCWINESTTVRTYAQ